MHNIEYDPGYKALTAAHGSDEMRGAMLEPFKEYIEKRKKERRAKRTGRRYVRMHPIKPEDVSRRV